MDCLSFVTEVGKQLWDPIKGVINYLVSYRTNIESFGNQVADLKAKKKDVENRMEESQWNLKEPTKEVRRWLERVNGIEESARKIQTKADEDKRWLKGLCPDWISRYNVSKDAAQMEETIKEQLQKENFSTVPQPLPCVIPKRGNYVVGLESIEWAKDQLMKLLDEENIRAIGVYGMGGVGKTTLMEMLNNELEEKKAFAKVIFVTVSNSPNLKIIQNEIAKRLGLTLSDEDSLSVRADDLSKRLKQEKKVLIILDDVWKRLEVSDVGIPSETEHKGCKIIVTSRKESVCTKMDTNTNIEMELLSEEESWALFKLKAGEVVDSPELQHVVKMVMRECKGLPLALVTVGLSLKKIDNKIIWREALRKLQSSVPTELEELEEYSSVISSLQFSYDFLEGGLSIRLYFLFCCLFPEDEEILLERLFWYGFGEDFLRVDGTLEEASNKGIFFAHRLKDSGLLLDGDKEQEVKMHDVVRDVAMYIAMKDGHGFFVRAGLELEEWPESEGNEEYKRISLMYNNIKVLPDELKRPKLQTLLLQGNRYLEDIPDNFFTWMPSLRVLDLSHTGIKSLPPSLLCLTNLRTLCMEDCERLEDVSLLGGMEKLEILNLNHCVMIRELPLELCRLTNLKLLNLMYNHITKLPEVLKCPKLQTLLLQGNYDLEDIPDNFFTWMPSLRVLDLSRTGIKSLPLSLSCLTNLRTLCMNICERLQDVSLLGGMEKLEKLNLNGCRMIRELPLELCRLTNLKLLDLRWMQRLERIPFGVISKLTRLEILHMQCGFSRWDDIDEENVTGKIASFAEMASLNRLTDLEVESKRGECLFQDMEGGTWRKLNRFDILVGEVMRSSYHYDMRKKMKLGIWSPNLANWVKVLLERTEELHLEGCKDVESLEQLDVNLVGSNSLVNLSFANLQKLRLQEIPNLKKLWHGAAPSRHDDKGMERLIKLQSTPLPPPPTRFTNLQELEISSCGKLKNIFTLNLAGGLHKLHSLRVWYCESMKELISKDDEKEEEEIKEEEEEFKMCKTLFPQLQTLMLSNLSELTCFYSGGGRRGGSGNMLFDFPSLETIRIKDCPKLKRLPFGPHTAPNLKKFKCEEEWLKGLEWVDDDDDSDSIRSRLQSICSLENKYI